jgi:DNA repair protein RecO (recombination protein O)
MPVFTTPAFVLRSFPHKESDLIVRLFTEQHGKLAGIARGARRPKSPLTGRLEILALGEVKGYRAEGRELCSLDAVSPLESWPALRSSLPGFYRLHYLAELLDTAFEDEQPHTAVFALLQGLLTLLEHEALDPDLGLRYLELRLLDELGWGPSFEACAACHGAGKPLAGLEPAEGGLLCASCVATHPEALRLPPEAVAEMERLSRSSLGSLGPEPLPRALRRPLRHACQRLLLYRLERPIRSARYLEEMDEEP